MLPYIILFVTSLLGVVQYDINRHNRTKKIAWYFLFCYVILLVGLRYRVGSDTLVYIWGYDRLPSWGELNWSEIWSYEFQPLYVLLCAIAKSISPDFTVLQILHAFIINSCIFYFIRKNTQYPFTGLFLYFFLYFFYFNTEILRESLAIGIFLLNYKNLENKRWLRFYCGVFVSVLFHFSALILVFFPFIRLIKFNWKYLLVISLFCAFLISMRLSAWRGKEVANERIGYAGCPQCQKNSSLFVPIRGWGNECQLDIVQGYAIHVFPNFVVMATKILYKRTEPMGLIRLRVCAFRHRSNCLSNNFRTIHQLPDAVLCPVSC